jgi:hypothetical protein
MCGRAASASRSTASTSLSDIFAAANDPSPCPVGDSPRRRAEDDGPAVGNGRKDQGMSNFLSLEEPDGYVEGLRAAAAIALDLHAKASGAHPFDKGARRNCKRVLDTINQMLIKEGAAPLALPQ